MISLKNYESLNLYETQVKNLALLHKLTGLKYLDLVGTQVRQADIDKLKEVLPDCEIEHDY